MPTRYKFEKDKVVYVGELNSNCNSTTEVRVIVEGMTLFDIYPCFQDGVTYYKLFFADEKYRKIKVSICKE